MMILDLTQELRDWDSISDVFDDERLLAAMGGDGIGDTAFFFGLLMIFERSRGRGFDFSFVDSPPSDGDLTPTNSLPSFTLSSSSHAGRTTLPSVLRYQTPSTAKDLLSFIGHTSARLPQVQVANLCPPLSSGRPGFRTSIRILFVWAHDVARWPRIQGAMGVCQFWGKGNEREDWG